MSITHQQLDSHLRKIGLKIGDVVFIHSDLRCFGLPEGKHSRQDILSFYFDTLKGIIGEEGTIAVPAYFYEYARFGTPFDIDHSPVSTSLGSFSQWINSLPSRRRSWNPLQSIAAIGGQAKDLVGEKTLTGYGVTSPWHRLRQLNGKVLFLGAPLQSMTFVHYIEQQYGVPHLYFKIYSFPIIKDGKPLNCEPISAVRYLDFSIEYDLKAYRQELIKQGALHTTEINAALIEIVDAEAAFQIGIDCLIKDPYFFLKNPPKFIAGKIPLDGATGQLNEAKK